MREQKNKYIFSIFENNFLMAPSKRVNENIEGVFQVFNLDISIAMACFNRAEWQDI